MLIITYACDNPERPVYNPGPGQPNLTLMEGNWKGIVEEHNSRGNIGFTAQLRHNIVLEMRGKVAGELDILYFNALDSTGRRKVTDWIDKLYVSNGKINYITNDYIVSDWKQKDSLSFNWFLLGKSFWDDKIGNYKNYVTFKRENDSLFIITGRMILEDTTFKVDYYSRYTKFEFK
ncbi:MAG: hypothetical protein C0598_06045 [Marinilabiliales bacterium]|nr:MAG: hypothetical protein C0598_06045 [Marinilabiliales bacterium]